ncbi:MAG: KamA family protein [Bacteroidales bacterium]|nr:KamA family protein [Bacteroidales bacterium]
MKQTDILFLHPKQLLALFSRKFPALVALAKENNRAETFGAQLKSYIQNHPNHGSKPAQSILTLLQNNNTTIHELSTEEDLRINTITLLWEWLRGGANNTITSDFILELYHQFAFLYNPDFQKPTAKKVAAWMKRWNSGLSPRIVQGREENKERIIRLLMARIENRQAGKYVFPEGATYLAKFNLVEQWWNDYNFHLAMAARKPSDLNMLLNNTLSDETMALLKEARKKGIPTFATPYYLSLLNTSEEGYNDLAIRNYVIYSKELVETFGDIVAWEREDQVEPGKPNVAGWLLPNTKNIHRRYPDVAILIPDSVGRACGGLCASCQRMYDFQRQNLNFDLEKLKPKATWNQKLRSLMKYYEEDSQLRDILITGGDALMSQNKTLKNLLDAIYKMAVRKRKANLKRPNGKKYAEMQRIRLGTRLLAYLPMRVNDELVQILKDFKEKASAIGFKQFIIQTHFQSPLEITLESKRAIKKILSTGWTITNQLVFTVSASRRGHTAQLRRKLNKLGVICYYTFSVKGFQENYAVFAPNCRAIQKREEEKILGALTEEQEDAICDMFEQGDNVYKNVRAFMKEHKLPFLATDRDVLNLPGIGKSMTYRTIGITADGKRILCFEHDQNRQHSPVIDNMENVFIIENKSVAAYLRQLKEYGENPNNYSSIWYYTTGETERRFKLYEYPKYDFNTTNKLTHFKAQ